jgi:hypothetical protein
MSRQRAAAGDFRRPSVIKNLVSVEFGIAYGG